MKTHTEAKARTGKQRLKRDTEAAKKTQRLGNKERQRWGKRVNHRTEERQGGEVRARTYV